MPSGVRLLPVSCCPYCGQLDDGLGDATSWTDRTGLGLVPSRRPGRHRNLLATPRGLDSTGIPDSLDRWGCCSDEHRCDHSSCHVSEDVSLFMFPSVAHPGNNPQVFELPKNRMSWK